MLKLIGRSLKSRTGFTATLFALLVPLFFLMGDFSRAVFVKFTLQGLPFAVEILLRIVGILLSSLFFYLLLRELIREGEDNGAETLEAAHAVADVEIGGEPPAPDASDGQGEAESTADGSIDKQESAPAAAQAVREGGPFLAAFLNFLFGTCLLVPIKYVAPLILEPGLSAGFIAGVSAVVLIALLLVVFLVASWIIVYRKATMGSYLESLSQAFKLCYGKMSFLSVAIVATIVFISVTCLAYALLWELLKDTFLDPLTSLFYRFSIVSCMAGFMIIIMIKVIHGSFRMAIQDLKVKSAMPGFILIAIFFIGTVYGLLPSTGSASSDIEKQYSMLTSEAESFRTEGSLYLCGSDYKRAYALTKAYESFLGSHIAIRGGNMTEEKKRSLMETADQSIRTAYEIWPNSGVIYYIDAIRQLETNPGNSTGLMETAVKLSPGFYDSYFMLMKLYKQEGSNEKAKELADELIRAGRYSQLSPLADMKVDAAQRLLEKCAGMERACVENFTSTALFYYENQLYPEAMDELVKIQKVVPENLELNYLLAVTDLEIKADGKAYDVAVKASQKILSQYPNEKWAVDFARGVALRAGNQDVAESTLKEAYKKNPGDPDIAEQYAYSLLLKNTGFNYSEEAKQAEKVIDGVLENTDGRWFAIYSKAIIELFKGDYDDSLGHALKFAGIASNNMEVHDIYDDLYNLYIMKMVYLMKQDPKAVDAVDKLKATSPFLYDYVYGAYNWKMADYEKSEKLLNSAIYLEPSLSKPYYLLGNVFFEVAGTQNKPEYYARAEEQYRRGLQIFPEDPYAWFALGHVLKKTGRFEEAVGAFQKTLSFMPAEDHDTDYYGVCIHSQMEIDEIRTMLKLKGGQ
jgi:tetratricopeptide (TPR) repeat protein